MPLYFAYGSNLSHARMKERCGEGATAGPHARLDGYRFLINSRLKATIVKAEGSHVFGGLWELNEAAEKALDASEGVAGGYYAKNTHPVTLCDGSRVDALVYIASCAEPPDSAPRDWAAKDYATYSSHIRTGAKEFNLPPEYIATLDAALDAPLTTPAAPPPTPSAAPPRS